MNAQTSLLGEPDDLNSLHVLINGEDVSQITVPDIFDSRRFDTFTGVTYSASGRFISKY